MLDHTALVFVHEHAEAGPHKVNGQGVLVAGHAGKLVTGRHTKSQGTIGDLYMAVADGALNAGIGSFPSASKRLPGVVA